MTSKILNGYAKHGIIRIYSELIGTLSLHDKGFTVLSIFFVLYLISKWSKQDGFFC